MTIILGAGLAGCIAGHLFPGSVLLEAGKPEEVGQHKALLRFRSDGISRITGIPFRKVRVHKGVYLGGHLESANPIPMHLLNWYALKVTGSVTDRSIGSLEPVDRWIAPEDFHAQMIQRLTVHYNWTLMSASKLLLMASNNPGQRHNGGKDWERAEDHVISTIPLPGMMQAVGMEHELRITRFVRAPIFVQRAKIQRCDVFQTLYYPGPETDVYRASITGDNFIIESVTREPNEKDWDMVCRSFGIDPGSLDIGPTTQQRFGKISPLPDDERHSILLEISQRANVFSFGRFACWKNLLLDDLPADAEKIRGMMRMSQYQRRLEAL